MQIQSDKGRGNQGTKNNDGSSCWDCNKQGVKRGHDDCPSPGSGTYEPEHVKKNRQKQKQANAATKTKAEKKKAEEKKPFVHPTIEKKDGKVYCRKCFLTLPNGKKVRGLWRKEDHPNAHMTAGHDTTFPKQPGAHLLMTNPSPLLCMPAGPGSIPPPPAAPSPKSLTKEDALYLLSLDDDDRRAALTTLVTQAPVSAPKVASLQPSAALNNAPPAPAPTGALEMHFGLMDDVSAHMDDDEEFVDADIDQAWLSSIKFDVNDDEEDPDKEEVSP